LCVNIIKIKKINNYSNNLLLSTPTSSNDKSTYSSITGPTVTFNMKQRNLFKQIF